LIQPLLRHLFKDNTSPLTGTTQKKFTARDPRHRRPRRLRARNSLPDNNGNGIMRKQVSAQSFAPIRRGDAK
jgi:hypothetical protein